MPAGLQVWGADGQLRLDTTTSLCHIVGIVGGLVPGNSGSVFVPPPGRAWFTLIHQGSVSPLDTGFLFSITGDPYSGQTISWSWNGQFVDPLVGINLNMVYGGY